MVSFPRLSQTIRMTALLGRLGRSFLIVMDLFEDCPCDLKCNSNCAANNDEQLQNIVQHHDASPLPRLRPGEATIRFHTPGSLPGKLDHLFMQTTPAAVSGGIFILAHSPPYYNQVPDCKPPRNFIVDHLSPAALYSGTDAL